MKQDLTKCGLREADKINEDVKSCSRFCIGTEKMLNTREKIQKSNLHEDHDESSVSFVLILRQHY